MYTIASLRCFNNRWELIFIALYRIVSIDSVELRQQGGAGVKVVEIVLVLIVVAAALGLTLILTAKGVERKREQRAERIKNETERKNQQALAGVAPAVLRGDPLLPVVIDQGRQLQLASSVFTELLADDLFIVLPDEKKLKIRNWQQRYEQSLASGG